ncbi:MAG: SHOCT domain-containing protein [Acidimicrobiales bacterium]
MLAYDYPLGGVFISMIWFFLFFIWIMLLFRVFADVFRSKDLGGFAKFLWILFVIITPFLGIFVYLIARGHKMAERDIEDMQAQDAAMKEYIRSAAGSGGSAADELERLAQLKANGTISEEEFNQMKAKIVG